MAIVSAVLEGFVFNAMVYADFSVGDFIRFVGGPGLGFGVVSVDGLTAGDLRIAALIGGEFLTADRLFGFRLMTRPFFDVGFGEVGVAVGGGALLELGFNFYVTRA